MSTIEEIRTAITLLNPRDQALLTAELFAITAEPDEKELEVALQRGLDDVAAGRVQRSEDVKSMILEGTLKRHSPSRR